MQTVQKEETTTTKLKKILNLKIRLLTQHNNRLTVIISINSKASTAMRLDVRLPVSGRRLAASRHKSTLKTDNLI